ncbi:zinc finger protein DZIP1L [Platysternon megacephalum]|uniref:Zinc finger protein DZIP1L n=1 Tax=Platysternon megacephalum TaxID=55544 RepID=A0A4D9EWU1_9SAUR|nr:zinc finger protein DZIP1L [Platysternon megacephalum]
MQGPKFRPRIISLLQTILLFSLVVFSLSLKRSHEVLVVFHEKQSKSDRYLEGGDF